MPRRELDPDVRHDLHVLTRFGGSGLLAAAVATTAGYQMRTVTPPWIFGVVCMVGSLLLAAGMIAAARYRPVRASVPTRARRWRSDRESGGLRRVELMLDRGLSDVERFNGRVRPWLIELAGQRLHHRRGVDLHHDPDSARDLLGGSLWQLTRQPLTTAPSRRQLADWVSRLEKL